MGAAASGVSLAYANCIVNGLTPQRHNGTLVVLRVQGLPVLPLQDNFWRLYCNLSYCHMAVSINYIKYNKSSMVERSTRCKP